ncbi:MAG: winged helix-turn-helix domain-containing protein, partial [Mediterranea sp.]|nr:winged helix-turn-helix domain-containing protein [Mediterranea sp.]
NNESSLSEDIRAFAQQIKSLHNMAVVEYTPFVRDICSRTATENEVGRMLDLLFGFAGDERIKLLHKQVCRHYWQIYPEIEMRWQDVGLSFQVQFVKASHVTDVTDDVTDVTEDNKLRLLDLIRQNNRITTAEIAQALALSTRQCKPLKEEGKLSRTGNAKTGQWILI